MQVCLSTNIECSYSMCLFSVCPDLFINLIYIIDEKRVSVRGSLSRRSLFGGEGSLSRRPPGQRPPCTVTCGRYASYWNAFLFSLISPVTRFILVAFRLSQNKFHGCDFILFPILLVLIGPCSSCVSFTVLLNKLNNPQCFFQKHCLY